jgi:PAS domain S-box-containing protein
VLRYLVVLVAILAISIAIYLHYQHPPPRNAVIGSTLGLGLLLLILASAWLGYGPGLLCAVLVCFALPRILPRSGTTNTVLQFAVISVMSLLVSRVADVGRRRRADFRHAAAELERRVQERTEEALAAADEARERAELLELARDAILSLSADGSIRYWNAGAQKMYSWSSEEAAGKNVHDLLRTRFPEPLDRIQSRLLSDGHWEGELEHARRDGTVVRVLSRWALRHDAEGRPAGILEINTDITERRKIEDQLRHTQKLESLGVLAGGVAHDFNNLLTGILGNASLALDSVGPRDPNRYSLEEVMRAAERAADLTRQLLAYAGKGRFVLRALDFSELVREISGLVQTSIPKHVQLRLQLADKLPAVEADAGQLQQIVMNLVINGAEAIGPEGGTVLVRTGAQAVDEPYIRTVSEAADQLRPGLYVMLEVHDTGCGMSADTVSKIFDPFFTTKFTGRGLGLSAVQGIVRAHHGALKVYSTPGQGTTFKVLLPASGAAPAETAPSFTGDLAGQGSILVVDDEDVVRQTARNTLARYGYEPVLARDGAEAVATFRRDPGRFVLVLLDLTMPVMSGEQALREMQLVRPGVRVLLTSGYNEVEAVQRFAGKGLAGFIQKPYTSLALASKIKELLDS